MKSHNYLYNANDDVHMCVCVARNVAVVTSNYPAL